MASTTNNSGLNGNPDDEFGPDEQYDDETLSEFKQRMERKRKFENDKKDYEKTKMPPCIG